MLAPILALMLAAALVVAPATDLQSQQAPARAPGDRPLSAIDWLNDNAAQRGSGPVLLEPPVTDTATQPSVEVSQLERVETPLGLVPATATGLPVDLWKNSDAEDLARLIADAPVLNSPAMQVLLYSLLLSETRPPAGADQAETMLLARLDRLSDLGAADPAQALIEQAGATRNPDRFARWFDATLLTGDEHLSCDALLTTPSLTRDYSAHIFCEVRGGDWSTAALTLEAAHALDLMPLAQLYLLDRFLSPEMFEGAPLLPDPLLPDPLTFRLFEAIGERLPTSTLPRAFATADLRDVAGWKAQLEAAERLARTGALSPNSLLGLYTERLPAASGGIWDRVEAVQRFETALNAHSPDAVAKTLPAVWRAMQGAQLEVPFAALFADQLAAQNLLDPAARKIAYHIRLLSGGYEAAASTPPDQSAETRFLAALALGDPARVPAPDATAQAISDGFAASAAVPPEIQRKLDAGQLGAAILSAIAMFDTGARGNPRSLSGAIATLRRVGLEDTARRAALQLMLLDRS